MRDRLRSARRWVVKVGSSLLTADGKGLDHAIIEQWTTQIAALLADNRQVVLVSSGSIAEGVARLKLPKRPTRVHELQAAAAVGQMGLIRAYEAGFERYDQLTAQILLTHDDLADRRRYLNARATLSTLLTHGVLPIVNENDTVTTDEIKLGDNDTLGAQVANLIDADVLVLLTDQNGLFDKDPRSNPDAQLLERANASDPNILALAGPPGSSIGSGGMRTKILAAERAAQNGTTTVIANGREPNVLLRLRDGEPLGTMLTSDQKPLDARKRWLADHLRAKGTVTLDEGACRVLKEKGSSLLAVGVRACSGEFSRGELVSCIDKEGREVARGLTNYSAADTRKILGQSSDQFVQLLGYSGEPELVHRDNMIVFR
ncbi:glutamate 5-kinase [Granulosicoccus antarcticus]|uniref:Glutamate 5-kinase n=1 Tax=Granulosicoccus antarcticus IMCC3135 TaxID=1192854 RepID=A0A2Z2NKC0_9GAMM|nr:glutamate 5-kinase [Granulosicoccus antarcticus]ASJ70451.1 Glutamate 5-kinase [Granulosicoccus antarcticus IMCC3135]